MTAHPPPVRIVALAGTLCSPEVFAAVPEHLTDDVDLVPWSWLTDPGEWTLAAVADRVAQHAIAPGGDAVLVAGHSTGGALALTLALRHPGLVRGLILSNTGANMHGHGDVEAIIAGLQGDRGERVRRALLDRSFHEPPSPAMAAALQAYAAAVPVEAAVGILRSQAATDLVPELPRIDVPVVVAHGRLDEVRPLAHAELLVDRLPNARLWPIEAGHTPMWEAPGAYAEALRALADAVRR